MADVLTTYTTLRLMLLPPALPMLTDVTVNYYKKILNLADVIAMYKIVADVINTKADVIAYCLADVIANYMIVADVITTKADAIAFLLFMVLADVIANLM